MAQKTNAARLLDQAKITYELKEYEVDESDLSGVTVAAKICLPEDLVYKTLLIRGDKNGVLFACIPVRREVDLKALAALSGNKKAELVPLKEVLGLTGYIRGGVSPLGAKKRYPVFIEADAADLGKVSISAGVRGCQMILAPKDLISLTGATCGRISRPVG